jgi:hypothetical protein
VPTLTYRGCRVVSATKKSLGNANIVNTRKVLPTPFLYLQYDKEIFKAVNFCFLAEKRDVHTVNIVTAILTIYI